MNETAVMYGLFYQSILSSYTGKNSVCFLSGVGNNMGYATQAESFSVLGVPGAGKSSAVARILSLFPQVIEHIQYQGNVFFCKQIVYLNIQCPGDCSVKAACLSILAETDKAIGTVYGEKTKKSNEIPKREYCFKIALSNHSSGAPEKGCLAARLLLSVVNARNGFFNIVVPLLNISEKILQSCICDCPKKTYF